MATIEKRVELAFCPKCQTQLSFTQKNFVDGIVVYPDPCPKCLDELAYLKRVLKSKRMLKDLLRGLNKEPSGG